MFFMNSPFLDGMSNNGIIKNQAQSNPGSKLEQIMWDRKLLESRLDGMAGTEFRVVDGPETSFGPGGMGNPVWVIRKQVREKKGDTYRVTAVEATYFVMGEFIYMAPSLEDILRVRLVSLPRHHNHT
jgi:mediator of RNA polymerase II transcription subunit 6